MKDKFKDLVSDVQKLPITHDDIFSSFEEFKGPFTHLVTESGLL